MNILSVLVSDDVRVVYSIAAGTTVSLLPGKGFDKKKFSIDLDYDTNTQGKFEIKYWYLLHFLVEDLKQIFI